MNKGLIAGLLLVAVGTAAAEPVRAESGGNCFLVTATADARNPNVSTDRALRRLRRYIADHLSTGAGKTVGPTTTKCIRNACKAYATVCQH